ncbi:MAG: cheY [Fibrobacteres bacterium]|nr:cheY [Fibrobacterota bacterium]
MDLIKATPPLEAAPQEIMAVDGSAAMFKIYARAFSTTREIKTLRLVNFTSGRIALDWLGQNPARRPGAILLDRHMEGFSGMDMLIHLKADEKLSAIPVIMVSLHGEQAHVVEAIKGGASDFMVKPLQSGVLAAKLLRVLTAKDSALALKKERIAAIMTGELASG